MNRATPLFSVDMRKADGTLIDLTPYLIPINDGGIGDISQRLNFYSRETEFNLATLVFSNVNGRFSPGHVNCLWGASDYQDRRIRVRWGWQLENGTIYPLDDLHVGTIDEIIWTGSLDQRRAEIKTVDALDRVRTSDVPPIFEGILIDNTVPAAVIRTLLGATYADIPIEFIDLASFAAAEAIENSASMIMRKFRIRPGSWWNNITICLTHGGAGLRLNRHGQIQYFTYQPDTSSGSTHLQAPNLISVRGSETKSTIRNSVKSRRGDGADTNPPAAAGTATTIQKPTSIALLGGGKRGERWESPAERQLLYFNSQTPVDLVIDRDISIKARPGNRYTIEHTMDPTTYQVELGQRIKVTWPDLAWAAKDFTVRDRRLSPSRMLASFDIINTNWADSAYLYVNRTGHKVDDGKLIY